jgi:hypothetical protein
MLQRIADGRTDLVFDHVGAGNAATATDQHGTRLITWCAYYGDVSAIRFLLANGETPLDAGAAIDAKDISGDTPLSWASWHLRPDAILRKLCYGQFPIHPDRRSMARCLLGIPLTAPPP